MNSNIFDLRRVSSPELGSCLLGIDGMRDHKALYCSLAIPTTEPVIARKEMRWHERGSYDAINAKLSDIISFLWEGFVCRSVNDYWKTSKKKPLQLIETFIQRIGFSHRHSNRGLHG